MRAAELVERALAGDEDAIGLLKESITIGSIGGSWYCPDTSKPEWFWVKDEED